MSSTPAHQIFEFGDFELDSLKRVLVARSTGHPVDITGRVVEALIYLVERPGELVEKKALIDALWPHVVVEEGNLTQTIYTLRRALGEKAGEDRYIATVAGRGYRFVADVRTRSAEAPPATAVAAPETTPTPRRPKSLIAWGAAAAVVLIVAVGIFAWRAEAPGAARPAATTPRSIAVLAFVDMSAEQNQAHFAEGLSEEILNLLTRADALRVIARTSSFSFKDQNADIGTIARRLAVTHVLEGSVRKAGDRVRITAQLIDGATSAHVWSDTYDRDLDDVFGVQSEIAAAVADALQVTINRVVPTRGETRSTLAYEHYLQGRHLFHRRSGADLSQARTHFEKAVEIDPEYGRAWAGLAGTYLVWRYENLNPPDVMERWGVAARRAVEFAPDLAEAHVRAAQYRWHAGDEDAGYTHLARAQALDPQDPLLLAITAAQALSHGRLDAAIELQKKLVARDPLSATNRGNLGSFFIVAGRLEEAQAELERSLELSPASPITLANIADVLMLQGRADEALRVALRIPDEQVRDEKLTLAHFARGAAAEGEAMQARLLASAEQRTSDYQIAIAVAQVYAARNDPEGAFHWLATARRRADASLGHVAPWVVFDALTMSPFLKPLHGDPRWDALRPQMKPPHALLLQILPG